MKDAKNGSFDSLDFVISKQFVFTLSFVLLVLSRLMFDSTHLSELLGEKTTSVISSVLLMGAMLLMMFLAIFYKYPRKGVFLLVICIGIFGLSCFKCRATNLFISFLFLYYSNVIIDKKKFARTVIVLFAAMLIVVSSLSVSGLISMSVKERATSDALRYSLGFIHPNQVGIIVFEIIAMIFYIDAGTKHYRKYIKYIISGFLTIVTFLITNTFSFVALAMLLMAASFAYDVLLCQGWFSQKSLKRFFRIGLIVLAVIVAVVVYRIWNNPSILQGSLKTLRTRFVLSQRYIKAYGIKPFGSKIITGDDVAIPGFSSGYFYLDNGYARLLVEYGLIAGLTVMLGLFRAVSNLIRIPKWQYLIIMLCLLVYLFNEQRMITVFFNPMLLLMSEYIIPDHRARDGIFSGNKRMKLSIENTRTDG